jgi:hypothetical protein
MSTGETAPAAGGTAGATVLDWVIVAAATIALLALLVWVYRDRRPAPGTDEGAS